MRGFEVGVGGVSRKEDRPHVTSKKKKRHYLLILIESGDSGACR